jgi:leucyl/phenylalanyl-tRNA--protein transferase
MEGIFPMANSKFGRVEFYTADPRAVIPLNKIKMPKSLRQFLKKAEYYFSIDNAFPEVIVNCSQRDDTWISETIVKSYIELHNIGYAHSVETWKDGFLIGGLYGVAIGGAFFGESMFTKESNASKAAFYYLAHHLKEQGFILLDSQFINDHTKLLGAEEIPLVDYKLLLKKALKLKVSF